NMPTLGEKDEFVSYDIELMAEDIDESVIRTFEQINLVTGNGFSKVIARVNGITIEEVDTLGKTQETRKFKTFDDLELIKFRVNESYGEELGCFDSVDAVGTIQMNEF